MYKDKPMNDNLSNSNDHHDDSALSSLSNSKQSASCSKKHKKLNYPPYLKSKKQKQRNTMESMIDNDTKRLSSIHAILGPDMLFKISEFLTVPDVKRFKWSCKDINRNIHMTTMITKIGSTFFYDDRWNFRGSFGMKLSSIRLTPLLIPGNNAYACPAVLTFRYKSWKENGGRICISELPDSQPAVAGGEEVGNIVAQCPEAETERRNMVLTFLPKRGFSYHLSYKTGGVTRLLRNDVFILSAKLYSVCIGKEQQTENELLVCREDSVIGSTAFLR